MASKNKVRRNRSIHAMTTEQVQQVQQLRRSNAAQPHGKRPTRAKAKREAIASGW